MFKHPFRKALGLTALYSIIIIGIFVLQFRNESVILKNIGLLRMSVAQTQNSDGTMNLKNTLSVSFKGISFTADDVHPAVLSFKGQSEKTPLTLVSWEQPSEQSFKFNFNNDTSLIFTASDTGSKASLSVTALMPENCDNLSLYYKPVSGYSVTEQSKTRQLFSSKNIAYTMAAAEIQDTEICFNKNTNVAMYTRYDPSKTFSFASIPADSNGELASAYENTIKKFRSSLISSCTAAFADASTLSEQVVAAYVSEMAAQGKYSEAVENVPDSFKKGTRRTYYTAPYFNSLVAMYPSLEMANNNFKEMISNAVASNSFDVFAADYIDEFILRSPQNESVKNLVKMCSVVPDFKPTVAQAAGILKVYITLTNAGSSLASMLDNAVEPCLNTIAASCKMSSESLVVTDKDVTAGFVQSVETGSVLVDYGRIKSKSELVNGGYMIINTAFEQNPSLDLRTMAEVYPSLIKNNTAYPHTLIVDSKKSNPIWAWTCANNVTYTEDDASKTATLLISFKTGDSHYLILNGIKPFSGIEIYGLSFHTDPRFESYKSSGYVYNAATQTLFIKSRHKVSNEKIKLYFGEPPAPKPVEKTEPAPAVTEAAPAEYTPIPAAEPSSEQTSAEN